MPRLWDKGYRSTSAILKFTAGEDHVLDERLVAYDARASIAHARMLAKQGLLSTADCDAICAGLDALAAAHAAGQWSIELADEDAHSALERRLTERIGRDRGRVHLGRSRNDQVLVALRLYLRDTIGELAAGADAVIAGLERVAAEQGAIALPGYTHMQPAMPSSVALWAQGFAAEIGDDRDGLKNRAAACAEEPARFGRRLRRAESAARSRGHARCARLRQRARARHGRAAVTRQGRSVAAV